MPVKKWCAVFTLIGAACIVAAQPGTPEKPVSIKVDWTKTQPLRTTPTLQMVVNPMLRRGSPIHDATFAALKQLGADDVRYAASHPYPRGRRAAHERLAGQHPHAASVRGGSLDGNISARGDSLTRSRIG